MCISNAQIRIFCAIIFGGGNKVDFGVTLTINNMKLSTS